MERVAKKPEKDDARITAAIGASTPATNCGGSSAAGDEHEEDLYGRADSDTPTSSSHRDLARCLAVLAQLEAILTELDARARAKSLESQKE